jgi:hypothetical protein
MMIASVSPKFAGGSNGAGSNVVLQQPAVAFGQDAFAPQATATQFGMRKNLFLGTLLSGLLLLPGLFGCGRSDKPKEQKVDPSVASRAAQCALPVPVYEELQAGITGIRASSDSLKTLASTHEAQALLERNQAAIMDKQANEQQALLDKRCGERSAERMEKTFEGIKVEAVSRDGRDGAQDKNGN